MKTILLVLLLILCVFGAKAQTGSLSGSVTDSIGNKPLPGATVFLSNATKNTSTNADGSFLLKNISPGQYTLVVTYVGYTIYKKTILVGKDNQRLMIKMGATPLNLKEVTIRPDQNREAHLKLFFNAFVGISKNAAECTIVNPKVLSLDADPDSNTLEASAHDLLKIENRALGYRLNVILDKFKINYITKLLNYEGKIFYEELAGTAAQLKRWKKNRMVAYRGSLRQFYRSLIIGKTDVNGFEMYPVTYMPNSKRMPEELIREKLDEFKNVKINGFDSLTYWKYQQGLSKYYYHVEEERITPGSIVKPSAVDGLYDLHFTGHLYLLSKQKTTTGAFNTAQHVYTVLTLPAGLAVFDANGILTNTNDVLYEGHDLEKLADILPNDFIPDNEAPAFAASATTPAETPIDSLVAEKTYLHTDRETYTGGEDIWFKAYLLNGQSNELSNSSNNLYVELISPGANILERKTIRLDNGLGNGDFHLSDSIAPGTYRLRAYTSWMRNFGDNFLFEKMINIYSSLDRVTRSSPSKKELPIIKTEPAKTNLPPAPAPIVRFFPEGGSLINGVAGIVAFKAESSNGKGLALKGNILSASGTVLTDFACDSSGMGSLMITATMGEQLKASGTFSNGRLFSADLPAALATGFSLYIKNTDSLFRVSISTNQATLDQQQGKPITLIAKSKGKTVYTAQLPLNELQTTIAIPKAGLPAGICAITLYDALGKPQAERLVYVDENNPVQLNLSSDKKSYASKEKVTVTIKVTDQHNSPVKASLSLAAVDAGLVPVNNENIVSYLNLSSEIKGNIDHPNQYFNLNNPHRKQQLDLLLLTQGWRDFVWKRLADSTLKVTYLAEQGISISGRVRENWVNKSIPDANITLSAWQAQGSKVFGTKTDAAGKFSIDGINIMGNKEVTISAANNKGKKLGYILVDTITAYLYPAIKLLTVDTSYSPVVKAEIYRRAMLATKFRLSDTTHLREVIIRNLKAGHILSDTVFNITKADYPLKSLRDYMLEKMPGTDRSPWDPGIVIFYGMEPRSLKRGPRFPFFSTAGSNAKRITPKQYNARNAGVDYFNIPLDRITSIELMHNLNRDGIIQGPSPAGYIYDNVPGEYFDIFLTLKPGAFDRQGFQTANVAIDGYAEVREFYAPQYETADTRSDYRITIHWEPNIITNEKGEATVAYYNADPKTKIRVVVEGVSDKGVPVSNSVLYEVK